MPQLNKIMDYTQSLGSSCKTKDVPEIGTEVDLFDTLTTTRLNISCAVRLVSQFMHA